MLAGFNGLIGVTLQGVRDDAFWIEIDAGDDHVHEKGYVHGGVILSLLDIAMSRAAREGRSADAYLPTIEFSASFLRPIKRGSVSARGMVSATSNSLFRVDGSVLDADGRICATGRATFMVPRTGQT